MLKNIKKCYFQARLYVKKSTEVIICEKTPKIYVMLKNTEAQRYYVKKHQSYILFTFFSRL